MVDLKAGFKDWLINEKQYKERTSDEHVRCIKKICDKLYGRHDKNEINQLSENIIPMLAKYYEYSNKEYYLDRITVWYALDYFTEISNFVYSASNIPREQDGRTIKLYLYNKKQDFYIDSVSFELLSDYTQLFAAFCYGYGNQPKKIEYDEEQSFIKKIRNIVEENQIEQLKNVALHIVYEQKHISQEKNSLSQYCSFLQTKFISSHYDYKNNKVIQSIGNDNPNKKVDGNYEETRPLTGEHAMQIRVKIRRFIGNEDFNCVLVIKDLAKIFNIDPDTVMKILKRFDFDSEQTAIRVYYSTISANKCLNKFHYHTVISSTVDYTLEGYQYWCSREKALSKILKIGKSAFDSRIAEKNTFTNYASYAPKYYIPELEYLKNSIEIKRVKYRKKYTKTTN